MESTKTPTSSSTPLHLKLIDLYLNVKVRNTEEIAAYNEEKLTKEREVLLSTDPLLIIDYIKTSIEILMNLRIEELIQIRDQGKSNNVSMNSEISQKESMNLYDDALRKLESETRAHIRVEQQMKLHIEGLQQKIEDDEKDKETMKKKYDELLKENNENKEKSKKRNTELAVLIKKAEKRISELEDQVKQKNEQASKKQPENEISPLTERLIQKKSPHTQRSVTAASISSATIDYTKPTKAVHDKSLYAITKEDEKSNIIANITGPVLGDRSYRGKNKEDNSVLRYNVNNKLKMKFAKIEAELNKSGANALGVNKQTNNSDAHAHLRCKSHYNERKSESQLDASNSRRFREKAQPRQKEGASVNSKSVERILQKNSTEMLKHAINHVPHNANSKSASTLPSKAVKTSSKYNNKEPTATSSIQNKINLYEKDYNGAERIPLIQ